MADNMGKSLRKRATTAVTGAFSNLKTDVKNIGDFVKKDWEQNGKKWAESAKKGLDGALKTVMMNAIGLAVTALPSALAFAGAIVGAVGSTIVTALAAIGPAVAGGAIAVAAGFGTMKLSMGLFSLAMKAATPALADFQKRSQAFKDTIATPIQAGMLSGFNAAMRISGPVIKGLTPMLKEFGNNVGDIAINFADALRQGAMMARLQQILTVNNDAVKLGGAGVSALAQAFIILFSHMGPVIEYLASGVRDLGQWALTAIMAAEATGSLDGFIGRMFNSMTFFVGALVDFAVGIWNVFKAAFDVSGGMINNLAQIGARFREWTGSAEGQAKMTAFFENMRVITGRVLAILGQITKASGGALAGTNVDSVLNGLNTMVSVGKSLADVFGQIRKAAGNNLGQAFQAFADMLVNLAKSGVLGTLTTAFTNLFNIISMLLNIPGIGPLLALFGGFAAMAKTLMLVYGLFKPIIGLLTQIWRILGFVIEFVQWMVFIFGGAAVGIVAAIAVVIGALIWFFGFTETGRHILAVVWDAIKTAIMAAVDAIVVAFHWVVNALGVAWNWIAGAAKAIWSALVTAFNAVAGAVSTAMSTVWSVIQTVWNAIWGFIQPILQGIWGFITTVFNAIVSVISVVMDVIYQIWIRVWPLLALPIRIFYGLVILIWNAIYAFLSFVIGAIVDFVVWAWNGMVSGISIALNAIWSFIVFIWNAVWGFIQPIIAAIVGWIVDSWNNVVAGVSFALNWIWGVITAVWNAIWGFIQPILSAIGSFIAGVWNGVYSWVSNALSRVWGAITSVWNTITGFISSTMDTIGGLIKQGWDFIGGVGTGILNGLKAAVNVVIGAINTVIHGINWAIGVANKLPGADIPTIPDIPKLARGGVVSPRDGGTLAMIAEAGRPERVEPLDPQGLSQRDRAIINELAGASAKGANVQVYIGTRELTELVDVVVEERESSLADRVLTGTKG